MKTELFILTIVVSTLFGCGDPSNSTTDSTPDLPEGSSCWNFNKHDFGHIVNGFCR